MTQVKIVENGLQAKKEIEQFIKQGFEKDEVYLLAHGKDRSEDLSDALDTNEIGVNEQGVFDSIANVFRSRGDELRSKMESLGLTNTEAQQFEKELDRGRVLVVAAK
ncbi:general stress protein [Bacillus sp. ISL-40]|uniref:general stress protein n=1 Tax=unclassified Bacillus (in: firmicutes) TaxID=185979 RepID=UPI001BE98D61|nr:MULTISPECIES: general stress protein [unclassified Bacillus (in: firmicutes)]MBT2699718.1 general stress protein [Bacillus sp. ISL-40]MBT2739517.1 general stress protein [Bacillus sp. ISL-77]